MTSKTMTFPAYTVGSGATLALARVCAPLGQRVFVAGGATALAKALPQLEQGAKAGGLTLLGPHPYGRDCTQAAIEALAQAAAGESAQVVLGVGGGKAIDTAKAAADQLGLPFVSVPTISATCAAVTALSVVYDGQGVFEGFHFCAAPPVHALIDLDLIAQAPKKYLRAGMGDALAKHYEATASMAGEQPPYESVLGQAVSSACVTPILAWGAEALGDCQAGRATPALEQVVLASVVSTGLVSLLVEEQYNGAVAHSLFYGLIQLPHIEERYLHGDVVAYGVLVQLALLHHPQLAETARLLKQLGCPTRAADLDLTLDQKALAPVLKSTLAQPDLAHYPHPISTQLLWEALLRVEGLNTAKE